MSKGRKTDLPESELKVMQLLEDGRSFDAIDQELGVEAGISRGYYRSARSVLSRDELILRFPVVAFSVDEHEFDALEQEVVQEAKAAGIPDRIMSQIQKRIKARTGKSARPALRRYSQRELIAEFESKLSLSLEYLDDFALSSATAKDLSITADVLNKNIQLLKGLPTQIVSKDDRKKINDLIPALLEEAKRRGVELKPIDGVFRVDPAEPGVSSVSVLVDQ